MIYFSLNWLSTNFQQRFKALSWFGCGGSQHSPKLAKIKTYVTETAPPRDKFSTFIPRVQWKLRHPWGRCSPGSQKSDMDIYKSFTIRMPRIGSSLDETSLNQHHGNWMCNKCLVKDLSSNALWVCNFFFQIARKDNETLSGFVLTRNKMVDH